MSPDGTIGVAQLELTQRGWDVPPETGQALIRLAEQHSTDDVEIAVGGVVIQNSEEGGSPEGIGMLAAAVILLIAFGSVIAAGLPLAVALFGLGICASLITVLAAFVDVPDFAPAVAGLIGIGVGVDYALLVLTRFRAALETKAPRDAITEAVETAGRSVLVAGTTVLISVNGLFLMGVSYLQGVALSTSLAVLVVMAASVTLLPALLAFAGHKVNRLRIPGLGRGSLTSDHTPAARWSRMVQRRPVIALIAASALVLVLTAPVLDLKLGFPDAGNDREGTPTRTTYDMISRGFGPGANGPLLLVVDRPGGAGRRADDGPEHRGRRVRVRAAVGADDGGADHGAAGERRPRARAPRRAARQRHGRRHDRRLRRPGRARLRPPAAVHRRRRRPELPAAARGLPLTADRAQGGRDEPAVGRRRLRRDRLLRQRHLGRRADRHRHRHPGRALHPGDDVRDPVRPEHGLRGVPAQPRARGVPPPRRHHRRRSPRAWPARRA